MEVKNLFIPLSGSIFGRLSICVYDGLHAAREEQVEFLEECGGDLAPESKNHLLHFISSIRRGRAGKVGSVACGVGGWGAAGVGGRGRAGGVGSMVCGVGGWGQSGGERADRGGGVWRHAWQEIGS